MKNSLTWRNRAHTLTAEQSRAEQSRAEQSRAEQSRAEQSRAVNNFSADFCCLNLNIGMKRPISDTM